MSLCLLCFCALPWDPAVPVLCPVVWVWLSGFCLFFSPIGPPVTCPASASHAILCPLTSHPPSACSLKTSCVEMSEAGGKLEMTCIGLILMCILTGSYMRLIVKFQVQREVRSYLVQVYWPTVLTTILSWISFWMNYDSSAARVTIGKFSLSPPQEETWIILLRKQRQNREGGNDQPMTGLKCHPSCGQEPNSDTINTLFCLQTGA